ncbi:MAG TPA: cyclase family protein [Dongiaceae bacterium]|nr:cyclase family protein [Dongiaceae bacterium]
MDRHAIRFSQVIDLSHTITTDIPLWPGDPPVEFENVANIEEHGYFLRRFSIGEHSATHMNAPNTFYSDGKSIDGYAPQSLVKPAVVIDVRQKTAQNADYVITVDDIKAWEHQHGRIKRDSVVLFYTGWQERWHSPQQFFNADEQGGLHFPGIGGDASKFLLERRSAAGVGIDTHGVDAGQDTAYATNLQVLAANGIVLECLTRLDQLPPKGTTLVIGLLRLQGGSGSPVSVMAFVP